MKKALWALNIIGFIMTFGALCCYGYNKTITDLLFWFGLFLMIPNWFYQAKKNNAFQRVITIISILIIAAIGYIFFTGKTVKMPGKEPITIVHDK